MRLTEAHYRVLWFAADGADPSAPVSGVSTMVGGEDVWIVPPLEVEAARTAALELVAAGCVQVHRYVFETEQWEPLSEKAVRDLFEDPRYPEREETPAGFDACELGLTPTGEKTWAEAHRLFGRESQRVWELHREEWAAFTKRHPEFEERRDAYFDAEWRWVESGGERPTFPGDEYPDWPYHRKEG